MTPRRALWLLFLVAALLRGGYGLTRPEAPRWPDSRDYLTMARNLLAGHGPIISPEKQAFRAPGYPAFIAATFAVFGERHTAVRLLQSLVSAAVPVLLVLLGRELGRPRAGWIAGAAAVVWPHFVYFGGLLLTETQVTTLLLGASVLLARAHRTGEAWASLSGGVALGATVLTRFNFAPYVGCLAIVWLLVVPRHRWQFALVLAGYLVCLGPWAVRNHTVTGAFVPHSTHLGSHIWEAIGPGADGGPVADHIEWPAREGLSEVAWDRMLQRRAWAHARAHPMHLPGLMPIKLARLWSPVPNDPDSRTPTRVAVSLAFIVPTWLLAVAGLWLARREGVLARLWPLWLPALYISALCATISFGSVRYRVPIEPLVLLLAAIGLDMGLASRSKATPPDTP